MRSRSADRAGAFLRKLDLRRALQSGQVLRAVRKSLMEALESVLRRSKAREGDAFEREQTAVAGGLLER